MPSMKAIKRRIASVSNTKQIMKAMNLVAASRLQKDKEFLKAVRPLLTETKRIIGGVGFTEATADNIFVKNRKVKNAAFVVITSDRGLCGGYNVNISREALAVIKRTKNEKIIAVGSKGRDFFRRRNRNIISRYTSASNANFYEDAQQIGATLVSMYRAGEIDEVYVAHTKFESMLSHVPTVDRILPIASDEGSLKKPEDGMSYEPDVNTFLEHAVPTFVNAFLYGAMIESAVCEQAARMMSMDAATNNAAEIIEDLTLLYNRTRQGIITQEINEIVSGANALS
ncbi:MAG: ATP synthase F1 subunit gamma [Oscillospiraceae bacterium]|nr:ATP synthase F1 subunit gamma [Oscillospiraceae bacterium]